MSKQTYNIDEFAEMAGLTVRTLRSHIDKKLVPQPIKRQSKKETLRWRATDVEKHLGLEQKFAANDPAPQAGSIDAMIDAIVERKVREVLAEMLPQLEQLARQI